MLYAREDLPVLVFSGTIVRTPGASQLSETVTADRRNTALASLCAVACAVLVAALLLDRFLIAAVAKLVASSSFVLMAFNGRAPGSRYGTLILAGLVCSWFGDAFLIGKSQHWFLLGLSSFLLAHIAYIAAFTTIGVDRRRILVAAVPVAAIGAVVLLWLQPHLPPGLAWPVRLYTAVISLMIVAAFGTLGTGATRLIVAGACLFYLSDLSVAALRFTDPPFPTYVAGLPLYYAAQICLAASIAASGNRDPSTAHLRSSRPGNR